METSSNGNIYKKLLHLKGTERLYESENQRVYCEIVSPRDVRSYTQFFTNLTSKTRAEQRKQ